MSASDAPPPAPEPAHSRAYDLAFAAPLVLFYVLAVAGNAILIAHQWDHAGTTTARLTIADEVATLLFFGLQAILFLVRRLPVAKTYDFWPRAVAVLGANFNFTLLLLPHVALGPVWSTVSLTLTLGGTLASVVVLAWLGRAFAIFPEARSFVDKGPYRFVRHPLYLTEIVSMLGIMIGFRQPWAAMIVAAAITLQFRRMAFEEEILARAYSGYVEYRRKTARLIPGVY